MEKARLCAICGLDASFSNIVQGYQAGGQFRGSEELEACLTCVKCKVRVVHQACLMDGGDEFVCADCEP